MTDSGAPNAGSPLLFRLIRFDSDTEEEDVKEEAAVGDVATGEGASSFIGARAARRDVESAAIESPESFYSFLDAPNEAASGMADDSQVRALVEHFFGLLAQSRAMPVPTYAWVVYATKVLKETIHAKLPACSKDQVVESNGCASASPTTGFVGVLTAQSNPDAQFNFALEDPNRSDWNVAFFLAKRFRRRGLGTRMVDAVFHWLGASPPIDVSNENPTNMSAPSNELAEPAFGSPCKVQLAVRASNLPALNFCRMMRLRWTGRDIRRFSEDEATDETTPGVLTSRISVGGSGALPFNCTSNAAVVTESAPAGGAHTPITTLQTLSSKHTQTGICTGIAGVCAIVFQQWKSEQNDARHYDRSVGVTIEVEVLGASQLKIPAGSANVLSSQTVGRQCFDVYVCNTSTPAMLIAQILGQFEACHQSSHRDGESFPSEPHSRRLLIVWSAMLEQGHSSNRPVLRMPSRLRLAYRREDTFVIVPLPVGSDTGIHTSEIAISFPSQSSPSPSTTPFSQFADEIVFLAHPQQADDSCAVFQCETEVFNESPTDQGFVKPGGSKSADLTSTAGRVFDGIVLSRFFKSMKSLKASMGPQRRLCCVPTQWLCGSLTIEGERAIFSKTFEFPFQSVRDASSSALLTVDSMVRQQRNQTPDKIALVYFSAAAVGAVPADPLDNTEGTELGLNSPVITLTYAELCRRTDVIESLLREKLGCLDVQSPQSSSSFSESRIGPEQVEQLLTAQFCAVTMVSDGPMLVLVELAILSAGGFFVPLAPSTPTAQLEGIFVDLRPRFIVCNREDFDMVKSLMASISDKSSSHGASSTAKSRWAPAVLLAEDLWELSQNQPVAANVEDFSNTTRTRVHTARHASHAIYTSGSTGSPKAVLVQHQSLASYCLAKAAAHSVSTTSRVLLASSFVFDPNLGDVFSTLASGATLCLTNRDVIYTRLSDVIGALQVTHALLTPAVWSLIDPNDKKTQDQISSLQCIALGGEVMSGQIIAAWGQPNRVQLHNTYGVTEVTVYNTMHLVRQSSSPRCIGKPLADNIILILDPTSGFAQPVVSPQQVGEIFLGGPQVGCGYIGQPSLSRRRFFDAPSEMIRKCASYLQPALRRLLNSKPSFTHPTCDSIAPFLRLYRTGDVGYWNEDGTVELLGRIDFQVKFNGHRIEPGEIEAALTQSTLVKDAVVLLCDDMDCNDKVLPVNNKFSSTARTSGRQFLAAYIALTDGLITNNLAADESNCRDDEVPFHCDQPDACQSDPRSHAWLLSQPLTQLLQRHCQDLLDTYKIPTFFFCAGGPSGQFVLTATQKKDRSKLQTKFSVEALRKSHRLHGEESGQGVSFQPPSSQTECLLARVWAKVLVGQPKDSPVASEHHFSVFDNFFHLGGDSLAALRVLRMLASEFDDQAILHNPTGQIQGALSPANFQQFPTIASFARHLERSGMSTKLKGADQHRVTPSETPLPQAQFHDSFLKAVCATHCTSDIVVAHWVSTLSPSRTLNPAHALTIGAQPRIHAGSEFGRLVVHELIAVHADADGSITRKCPGISPLHLAARNGHESIVAALLLGGATANIFNEQRQLPLHFAAGGRLVNDLNTRSGRASSVASPECLRLLLGAKASLRATDTNRQNVLHFAARAGTTSVLKILLQPTQSGNSASVCQTLSAMPPLPHNLLNARDRWQRTPLHWACLNSHPSSVAELLVAKALARPPMAPRRVRGRKTRLEHEAPLHIAARLPGKPSVHIMRMLLDAGAPTDDEGADSGRTPLAVLAHELTKRLEDSLLTIKPIASRKSGRGTATTVPVQQGGSNLESSSSAAANRDEGGTSVNSWAADRDDVAEGDAKLRQAEATVHFGATRLLREHLGVAKEKLGLLIQQRIESRGRRISGDLTAFEELQRCLQSLLQTSVSQEPGSTLKRALHDLLESVVQVLSTL